jgi:arsenic resistance protein ArsH
MKDDVQHTHPKVQELRDLSRWSDGHFWVSPEQHGNLVCEAVIFLSLVYVPLNTDNTCSTDRRLQKSN